MIHDENRMNPILKVLATAPTLRDIADAASDVFGDHVLSCPRCRSRSMEQDWCPEGLELDAARKVMFSISISEPRYG